MAGIAGGLVNFSFDFQGPVLALALMDLGVDSQELWIFFMLAEVTYFVSSIATPYLGQCITKKG